MLQALRLRERRIRGNAFGPHLTGRVHVSREGGATEPKISASANHSCTRTGLSASILPHRLL